jgi:hypothetical protein
MVLQCGPSGAMHFRNIDGLPHRLAQLSDAMHRIVAAPQASQSFNRQVYVVGAGALPEFLDDLVDIQINVD